MATSNARLGLRPAAAADADDDDALPALIGEDGEEAHEEAEEEEHERTAAPFPSPPPPPPPAGDGAALLLVEDEDEDEAEDGRLAALWHEGDERGAPHGDERGAPLDSDSARAYDGVLVDVGEATGDPTAANNPAVVAARCAHARADEREFPGTDSKRRAARLASPPRRSRSTEDMN